MLHCYITFYIKLNCVKRFTYLMKARAMQSFLTGLTVKILSFL